MDFMIGSIRYEHAKPTLIVSGFYFLMNASNIRESKASFFIESASLIAAFLHY